MRAAISAAGHRFPERRVTVNLAPAALRKSGAGLDLPIAIGILAAAGAIDGERLAATRPVGELALDGRIRSGSRRALARDRAARSRLHARRRAARERDGGGADTRTSRSSPPTICRPAPLPRDRRRPRRRAASRAARCGARRRSRSRRRARPGARQARTRGRCRGRPRPALRRPAGFGQDDARATPAGTAAAARLRGGARSDARYTAPRDGSPPKSPMLRVRPFRAPHHSASRAGLLGGGSPPRPGETALAHRGVLFLDELPEFDRGTLESLRQVLEERRVVVARAGGTCVFPGGLPARRGVESLPLRLAPQPLARLSCTDVAVRATRARLGSAARPHRPALSVSRRGMAGSADVRTPGESSEAVRDRVIDARERQRSDSCVSLATNAEIRMRHSTTRSQRRRRRARCSVAPSTVAPLGACRAATAARRADDRGSRGRGARRGDNDGGGARVSPRRKRGLSANR